MSESDLLDPWPSDAERASEGSLRPRKLEEFVGQARIREQLGIVLESARRRGLPPDHLLFSGPPGLGKTSLAAIVAAELGVGFRVTSGPALERAGDLRSPGDVGAALASQSAAGADPTAAPPPEPSPASPTWLRWHRATARASAVSAGVGTEARPSRALTM